GDGRATRPHAPITAERGGRSHAVSGAAVSVQTLAVTLSGRPILHEISFAATPGEVLAIIGSSGTGKSTLLRTLAGLVSPERGGIDVSGADVIEAALQVAGRGFLPGRPAAGVPAEGDVLMPRWRPPPVPRLLAVAASLLVALATARHVSAAGG